MSSTPKLPPDIELDPSVSLDDVVRRLLAAKPAIKPAKDQESAKPEPRRKPAKKSVA